MEADNRYAKHLAGGRGMTALRVFVSRLWGVFRRSDSARIQSEITEHIRLSTEDFERRGLDPQTARHEALRDFGETTCVVEDWRDQATLPSLESLLRDARYAIKGLLRVPTFTVAVVLTLSLGLGANLAIFRILSTVLLHPLPVREPESLVAFRATLNDKPVNLSYTLYKEFAAKQHVFSSVLAFAPYSARTFDIGNRALANIQGRLVTGSYFNLLGVRPFRGRLLEEADDGPNAPTVAVISHRFWRGSLNSRNDAIGMTLRVNQAPAVIVGIAPPDFFGETLGALPDFWMPLSDASALGTDWLQRPEVLWLAPLARLRPGVTWAAAQVESRELFRRLSGGGLVVSARDRWDISLLSGRRGVGDASERLSRHLWVLMALVVLVFLIACCNLSNLFLARMNARDHEFAIRLALGARRVRVLQQLFIESSVFALLGSAGGILIARVVTDQLTRLAARNLGIDIILGNDWRPITFIILATISVAIFFGVVSVCVALGQSTTPGRHMTQRATSYSRSFHLVGRSLIVAQVAISLILMLGASVFSQSFWNLLHEDLGYRPDNVLLAQLDNDFSTFLRSADAARQAILYQRLTALPETRFAALVSVGPFTAFQQPGSLSTPARPSRPTDNTRIAVVSPSYFEVMRIPRISGRFLSDADAYSQKVIVLSSTAAAMVFGQGDAIGQYVTVGGTFDVKEAREVVGVVGDIKFGGPRDQAGPTAFLPMRPGVPLSGFVVRTRNDPQRALPAILAAIGKSAPTFRFTNVQPLQTVLDSQLRREHMMALLSFAFGCLALTLVAIGVYGVITYNARQRISEIGIRLALGASRVSVIRTLLRETMILLTLGIGVGVICGLTLEKYFSTLLFRSSFHDPAVLIVTLLLLACVSVIAALLPARSALTMNLAGVLRQE